MTKRNVEVHTHTSVQFVILIYFSIIAINNTMPEYTSCVLCLGSSMLLKKQNYLLRKKEQRYVGQSEYVVCYIMFSCSKNKNAAVLCTHLLCQGVLDSCSQEFQKHFRAAVNFVNTSEVRSRQIHLQHFLSKFVCRRVLPKLVSEDNRSMFGQWQFKQSSLNC